MKGKTIQVKEQILNYSMLIKKIKGRSPTIQKNILENKKKYLLFSALIILSTIGYEIYKRDARLFESREKKTYSTSHVETRPTNTNGEKPLPTINVARLQLETVDNIDKLKVIIEGKGGGDKEDIKYYYEWFRNNEPVGTNTDSISGFRRGDKIDVKISSFDGNRYGQPKILSIEIAKITPKIIQSKEINYDGKNLFYQVKAVDQEGGTLKYSLVDAPQGMVINSETGMINWQVQEKDYGKHNIMVKISNKNGAEVLYPLAIDIGEITD